MGSGAMYQVKSSGVTWEIIPTEFVLGKR